MQGEFHSAQEVGRVLFTMSGRKCSADRFKATNLKGLRAFQALAVACSWSFLARMTVTVLVQVFSDAYKGVSVWQKQCSP